MIERTLHTQKYDIDLERLMVRRLAQAECTFSTRPTADGVTVSVEGRDALARFSAAVTALLCRDLQYFELAHMTDALPLDLTQKQEVLRDAIESARCREQFEEIRRGVQSYLTEAEEMNVEGYLLFRMQEPLEMWQSCVERAAADQMLYRECAELMKLIGAVVDPPPARIGELTVCLHPDGSCSLSDDSDVCIEYADCSDDGVLRLLIGMSPAHLTVYDLTGGRSRLAEQIAEVFAGRVRVFR